MYCKFSRHCSTAAPEDELQSPAMSFHLTIVSESIYVKSNALFPQTNKKYEQLALWVGTPPLNIQTAKKPITQNVTFHLPPETKLIYNTPCY